VIGDVCEHLLRSPHLAEQMYWIEGGKQAYHSLASLFRGSRVGQ
jgi:hypothetical protein